jgi:hypothetical protein
VPVSARTRRPPPLTTPPGRVRGECPGVPGRGGRTGARRRAPLGQLRRAANVAGSNPVSRSTPLLTIRGSVSRRA